MKFEDRLFQEAELSWDLAKLYLQLTQVKQLTTSRTAKLTATEKAILRGFLCNCSPKEIASQLHWKLNSLRVELTRGLYRYIETLTTHELNTIKNWRDIAQWLEEEGYKTSQPKQDLLQAPSISSFYGREKELEILEKKIIQDQYNLITLLGMGGIGKTTLAVKFAQQNQHQFKYIIWRNLHHTPLLKDLLRDLLRFFNHYHLPTTINEQISLLIECLHTERCLLIFDGLEKLLGINNLAGSYQKEHSNYSQLIKRIGEEFHQSCLLLTSQDEPIDMLFIRGNKVDSLQIGSLGDAAQEILKEIRFPRSHSWQTMSEHYGGNPLALKLVASTIKEFFGGNMVQFLGANQEFDIIVPTYFQQLLKEQFERLSALERNIICTLAVNRQPMSLKQLQDHLKLPVSLTKLLPPLKSLKKRSLIEVIDEKSNITLKLQPLIMKYLLTEQKDLVNVAIQ